MIQRCGGAIRGDAAGVDVHRGAAQADDQVPAVRRKRVGELQARRHEPTTGSPPSAQRAATWRQRYRRASRRPSCVVSLRDCGAALGRRPGRRLPRPMVDGARSVVIHGHELLPIDAAVIPGQPVSNAIQRLVQMARATVDAFGAPGSAASRHRPAGSSTCQRSAISPG
jgi:hypothetical protein